MHRRHYPLPKIWLMTDPRLYDLGGAIQRLPVRSGIIFRHYDLPKKARRALFRQVQKLAKARDHILLLADHPMLAKQWGADGAHNRSRHKSQGIRTVAVHDAREAALAKRLKADLIFVSPVFETRSHVGARALGTLGLGRVAGYQRGRTIALGGMTPSRTKSLRHLNIYGWAGIDAFRT